MAYYEYSDAKIGSYFSLTDHFQLDYPSFSQKEQLSQLFWNQGTQTIQILVDGVPIQLEPNKLSTLTYFHHLEIPKNQSPLSCFSFNRAFYCMLDHDEEVSCYGILFFGAQDIPIISLDEKEQYKYHLLYLVFIDEFQTRDNIQGEMLQMLLKRLVIKSTRLAKIQSVVQELSNPQIELIRKFNLLVDIHFKEKKGVGEYAILLHKSPKTLSNLFSIYNKKTPLQIIHERTILEAKRLLQFSKMSQKEIAYSLGFERPSQFSRLFKKVEGLSPSAFKKAKTTDK